MHSLDYANYVCNVYKFCSINHGRRTVKSFTCCRSCVYVLYEYSEVDNPDNG